MFLSCFRTLISAALILSVLLSSGCLFGDEEISPVKDRTQKPYTINGTMYHPHQNYDLCEIILASYYGHSDGFHGKLTATGDQFDKTLITAAHKTLPIPCIAEITDIKTKKRIIVHINDRGPFVKNRDLDLSYGAAQLLGGDILHKGVALVRLRILKKETRKLLEKMKKQKNIHR